MDPLSIVLLVLRGIATLNSNPALGGGGVRRERTSVLLSMFADLVEHGEETWEELKVFAGDIKLLVEQHGEPTRGQWDAMKARHEAAMGVIAENKARLLTEQAEEDAAAIKAKNKAEALATAARAKELAALEPAPAAPTVAGADFPLPQG